MANSVWHFILEGNADQIYWFNFHAVIYRNKIYCLVNIILCSVPFLFLLFWFKTTAMVWPIKVITIMHTKL